MDYLSLLTRQPTEGSTDTSVVARRLLQAGTYTTNSDVVREEHKTLAEATNNEDFLTAENVIGDPDTGARVTPFLTLDLMLETFGIKHPYVDESGKFLKGIENAMAIPIKHILQEPPYANKLDNGAAFNSTRSQIKFGFDPITEVLKNCCASQVVMHSFLKSCLMTLYEKVKEWGPHQLEQDGQETALCSIINIMGQVCAIIQEAKHATVHPYTMTKGGGSSNTKAAASCSRCGRKSCKSDIVSFFIKGADEIQERVCISAINKLRASAPSTTKPPPEFLVKDVIGNNSASKRIKLDDAVLCPNMPATSSNVQTAITRLAKNKIATKERNLRLIRGATLVLNQLQKEQKQEAAEAAATAADGQGLGQPPVNAIEATDASVPTPSMPSTITTTATASSFTATPSIASNIAAATTEAPSGTPSTSTITSSTTAPDLSKEGEGIDLDRMLVLNSQFLHAPLSPLLSPVRGDGGGPLAPTEEQVKELAPEAALEEAYGLTPGTEQVRRRDKSNVRSMAEYAKGGTGINTGKYRTFNASLGT